MPRKEKPIGGSDVSEEFQAHLTEVRGYTNDNIIDERDNIDTASNFPTQEVERFMVSYRAAAALTKCNAFAIFADHFAACMRGYQDGGAKKVVICQTKDPAANNRLIGMIGAPVQDDKKGPPT